MEKQFIEASIPTNEDSDKILCTPDGCLNPGRGLFAKDVLDLPVQIDIEGKAILGIIKKLKDTESKVAVHLGEFAFYYIKKYLKNKGEDTLIFKENLNTGCISFLIPKMGVDKINFIVDKTIDVNIAIIKHTEEVVSASVFAKDE